MPSKGVKVQHLTIALCEGLVNMLWEQRYKDQEKNKTFSHARERVISKVKEIREYIVKEQGRINTNDVEQIKKVIDEIKDNYLLDGYGFTPIMGVAIMTDMVLYQITITKGEKNKLFNELLTRINYLTRYYDPKNEYSGDDSKILEATEKMRELMGV